MKSGEKIMVYKVLDSKILADDVLVGDILANGIQADHILVGPFLVNNPLASGSLSNEVSIGAHSCWQYIVLYKAHLGSIDNQIVENLVCRALSCCVAMVC